MPGRNEQAQIEAENVATVVLSDQNTALGSVRHEILIQLTVGLGRRHHPPQEEHIPD